MTTQLISLNEYRKNISTLWKKAQKENIKYIVLSHSKPIFEVNPLHGNEVSDDWDIQYTAKNHEAYLEAVKDLENGKTHTVDFDTIKSTDDFIESLKK